MQLFKTKTELDYFVQDVKVQGNKVGFIPTMGALHKGHLSLIENSKKQADITVASIFVNPTQFNDPNDLINYPRNEEKDLDLLEKAGCDAVFLPTVEEMYPEKDIRIFDFDDIDAVMEGAHRPGHFNGVAQIVSKLFGIVKPQVAFFGQKDFQQVAIINKMVEKLKMPVEIVACPIIRESDGLAMSSRNLLLTPEHRKQAPIIYQTLKKANEQAHQKTVTEIKSWVVETLNNTGLFRVEYFEIVDRFSLKSVEKLSAPKNNIGCIAVWAGKIRLIDNITFNL
jgi:pantoate--beta-alanine ligase